MEIISYVEVKQGLLTPDSYDVSGYIQAAISKVFKDIDGVLISIKLRRIFDGLGGVFNCVNCDSRLVAVDITYLKKDISGKGLILKRTIKGRVGWCSRCDLIYEITFDGQPKLIVPDPDR